MLGPASWPVAGSASVVRPFAFRLARHVATPTPPRRRPAHLPTTGARKRWQPRRSNPRSSRPRRFGWGACRKSSRALCCSSGSVRIEDELPTQDRALHPHYGLPGGSAPAGPPPRAAPLDPRRAWAGRSVGSGVVLWSSSALCCSSGSIRIEDELPTQDRAFHPHHGLPLDSVPSRPLPRAAPLDPRRAWARGSAGSGVVRGSRTAPCCGSGSIRLSQGTGRRR